MQPLDPHSPTIRDDLKATGRLYLGVFAWLLSKAIPIGLAYLREATANGAPLKDGLGAALSFGALVVLPAMWIISIIAWIAAAHAFPATTPTRSTVLWAGLGFELVTNLVTSLCAVPGTLGWTITAIAITLIATIPYAAFFLRRSTRSPQ